MLNTVINKKLNQAVFTKRKLSFALAIGLFSATALHTAHAEEVNATPSLSQQWETEGFSWPESVLAIPGHEWLYVSNVNEGEPGFVSRITRDGKIDQLKWVDGITTATGMGYYDGKIYVADQTQIQVIELESGKLLAPIPATEAKALNDIAITKDGKILVSDVLSGSIHTVSDGKVIPWAKFEEAVLPNGVEIQGDDLIIGNMGTTLKQDMRTLTEDEYGALYRVNIADQSIELVEPTLKTGAYDGVVAYQDAILASNPFNGQLMYVANGKKTLLLDGVEGGIADIGMDTENDVLYAPMLFTGKVVAYQLNTQKPDAQKTKAKQIEDPAFQHVVVSQEGPVLIFQLDGPRQNGVSVLVLNALNHLLDMAEKDDAVGSIVITGTGEMFSDTAGGGGAEPPDGMTQSLYAQKTFDRMARFSKPIIGAINGKAGQGGLELAMSTDIRIASDKASFSQWEALVGLIPGFGGIQKLTALVGPAMASDMMITGHILSAEEALAVGLVSRISTHDQLRDDALELATTLAEITPTSSLKILKGRIADSKDETFAEAQNKDHIAFDKMLGSPEFQEALKKFMDRAAAKGQ
jgi:enoyl-CoA hydratase/carnithine racemase